MTKSDNNYLAIKETNRLIIRPLEPSDGKIWERFILNEEATRFFPNDSKGNAKHAYQWVERQLNRYQTGKFGLMALINKESNEFIGQSGLLMQVVEGKEELEVGYHLLPEFWGNGFAIEAAQEFKQIGFEEFNAESIISLIHRDNIPSQKVALNNGMKRTTTTTYKEFTVFIYRVNKNQKA